jgi:hypothetical protein
VRNCAFKNKNSFIYFTYISDEDENSEVVGLAPGKLFKYNVYQLSLNFSSDALRIDTVAITYLVITYLQDDKVPCELIYVVAVTYLTCYY